MTGDYLVRNFAHGAADVRFFAQTMFTMEAGEGMVATNDESTLVLVESLDLLGREGGFDVDELHGFLTG